MTKLMIINTKTMTVVAPATRIKSMMITMTTRLRTLSFVTATQKNIIMMIRQIINGTDRSKSYIDTSDIIKKYSQFHFESCLTWISAGPDPSLI